RFPAGPDVLRADALQHRLPRRGRTTGPPLRGGVRRLRLRGGPLRFVRGHGPRVPSRSVRDQSRRRTHLRTQRVHCGHPRGHRRRCVLPAPGDLPPHLPLASPARRGRQAVAPAARGEGSPAGRVTAGGTVLRFRRHVRVEERGDVHRHAGRQDALRAGHGRTGAHRGRQLVSDAHRWWSVPTAHRCAKRAPGGDPGEYGGAAVGRNPVTWLGSPTFPRAAHTALGDTQLRTNLRKATTTIRAKRAEAVAELPDWERLRKAGQTIKDDVLAHLDTYLVRLEEAVPARGGVVHWARDAAEANRIVLDLVRAKGVDEVVKVKSMVTAEIGLTPYLEAAGVRPVETDLAELIVQLGNDRPSHILVPAIHRNRAEIREIFVRGMSEVPSSDDPRELAEAARKHLRRKFLSAKVAISGANFAVAETGSIVVVESEG